MKARNVSARIPVHRSPAIATGTDRTLSLFSSSDGPAPAKGIPSEWPRLDQLGCLAPNESATAVALPSGSAAKAISPSVVKDQRPPRAAAALPSPPPRTRLNPERGTLSPPAVVAFKSVLVAPSPGSAKPANVRAGPKAPTLAGPTIGIVAVGLSVPAGL